MAIREFMSVSRALYGDGVSNMVTIDFKDEIHASNICGETADDVVNPVADKGGDVTAELSGSKVTFTFGVAPPEGIFTVSCQLLFGKDQKKKPTMEEMPVKEAPHHKEAHHHKK